MLDIIQVTAQYSNAVLVAIMPYISNFEKGLDVHAPPANMSQVAQFKCDPRLGKVGGAVFLTNGFQFTFLDGRVTIYRSPASYFSLQDPERTPEFYGPVNLNAEQASNVACGVIGRLGYKADMFSASGPPLITLPENVGTNQIARYRFRWIDRDWQERIGGRIVPALLDVEVNASNGEIEMVLNNSRDTRAAAPKVDVVPPLLPSGKGSGQDGGVPSDSVSSVYASSFLSEFLVRISDFVVKVGLNIRTPVTTNDVVMTNYVCRLLNGKAIGQVYLKNGDRFNYRDGYVCAYYAHDAFWGFPDLGNPTEFVGHINVTTNEAISLCKNVINRLGYAPDPPPPLIGYAFVKSPLSFTRYNYVFIRPGEDGEFASFEVDMESKAIKKVFLNDPVFGMQPGMSREH